MAIVWKVKEVLVKDLKENGWELREYSMIDIYNLKKTIEVDGMIEPLVVNKDLTVIDGELRVEVLKDLGIEKCLVSYPSRQLKEEDAKELRIRKNNDIAGVDDYGVLRREFDVEDLVRGGFDEYEIQDIATDLNEFEPDVKKKQWAKKLEFESEEGKNVAKAILRRFKRVYGVEDKMEDSLILFLKKDFKNG